LHKIKKFNHKIIIFLFHATCLSTRNQATSRLSQAKQVQATKHDRVFVLSLSHMSQAPGYERGSTGTRTKQAHSVHPLDLLLDGPRVLSGPYFNLLVEAATHLTQVSNQKC
jgi:hypothetical protein